MRTHTLVLVAAVLTTAIPCATAQGQLVVAPRADLRFGELIRGVPTSYGPLDVQNAGRFQIRGARNTPIRLEFLLPPSMTSPVGDAIPLTFGPGDALVALTGGGTVYFNPEDPVVVSIGRLSRVFVFLGGTATPSPTQPANSYSGLISLTVYNLGS